MIRFDCEGRTFAVYHSSDGEFFCTDGLVLDYLIECPKHNGQFDYRSGEPKRSPACEALKTYPVKVENGRIMVDLS